MQKGEEAVAGRHGHEAKERERRNWGGEGKTGETCSSRGDETRREELGGAEEKGRRLREGGRLELRMGRTRNRDAPGVGLDFFCFGAPFGAGEALAARLTPFDFPKFEEIQLGTRQDLEEKRKLT